MNASWFCCSNVFYQNDSKMKFKTEIDRMAWANCILITKEQALEIKETMGNRIIITINGMSFHRAVANSKEVGHYIMLGKNSLKKLGAWEGVEVEVEIKKDTSEYGAEMPEELDVVIGTDEEALLIFESLTPGKKRSIIHLVGSAKRSETRINRALKIVENLKMGVRDPRGFLK